MRAVINVVPAIFIPLAVLLVAAVPDGAPAEDCKKAGAYYDLAVRELTKSADRVYALEKAVALCPTHVKARIELARTLVDLKKLDKAAQQYERVLELDSKVLPAYKELGNIYCAQGRYEMAKKQCDAALAVKPGDTEFRARLKILDGKISSETGGFKKAGEIVQRVTKSLKTGGFSRLMGFQDYTEAKDRIRFNNILFDEWSYTLRNESIDQVKEIGNALQSPEMQRIRARIEGHTDNRGDPARNDKLSWDRADAVKKYLADHVGIDPSRLETQGYGFSKPRFPNDSPQHMQENRRVEIVFFD